jgi:copper homeostasis protein
MNRRVLVEICVGDVESAIAAEAGGADRIELCDNLAAGGTTPSAGTIAETCRWLSIPVHVMIRPRGGDFVYSERELSVMRHDIEVAKALGVAGIVLGVLTADGTIDRDRTAFFVKSAWPLSVTFHKAIDQTSDLDAALDTLVALGVGRVLTSGGSLTALEGVEVLAGLVRRASSQIAIMAGGGLHAENIGSVIRKTGVHEVHVGSVVKRAIVRKASSVEAAARKMTWSRTDAQRVASIVGLVQNTS